MEREKVLNALRCHANCDRGFDCGDCAYIGNGDCLDLLATDVYALLKDHEPKMVVVQDDGCPCCPTCGNELYSFPHYQKYCDECGQAVKWE